MTLPQGVDHVFLGEPRAEHSRPHIAHSLWQVRIGIAYGDYAFALAEMVVPHDDGVSISLVETIVNLIRTVDDLDRELFAQKIECVDLFL